MNPTTDTLERPHPDPLYAAPDAAGPSFAGFVDPVLVHRTRRSEVFLTDLRSDGPDGFAAAAVLPVGHPHFGNHAGPARDVLDLMLLLECCRQAETRAAHAVFGVEPGTAFVLRGWSARLTDGAWPPRGGPGTPMRVLINAATANRVDRGGRLCGLDYAFRAHVAGSIVAHVAMSVAYLGPDVYAAVRSRGRTTPPATSAALPGTAAGVPVEPRRVGRIRPTDTVLLDAVLEHDRTVATLRPPVENPSLFEHAHDHVPGMVLQEAARQLAALAGAEQGGGPAADRAALASLESEFHAFAELDAPVRLVAEPFGSGAVDVSFQQRGRQIARTRITHRAARPEAPRIPRPTAGVGRPTDNGGRP